MAEPKRHRFFGRSKKPAAPTTGEAINKLRDTEDMLNKKQEFLEAKMNRELEIVKKNAKTNKTVAMSALKRKKRLERQLQQIDGTLTTLEQQREALEGAHHNTAVLNVLGEGAKAMKQAHSNMDVDKVHDMMDDIAEQQDVAREISEAISQPTAFGQDFDEDELEAELEGLEAELDEAEQEALNRELLDMGPAVDHALPEVPSQPLPVAKAKKAVAVDDDMAELAAWAS